MLLTQIHMLPILFVSGINMVFFSFVFVFQMLENICEVQEDNACIG